MKISSNVGGGAQGAAAKNGAASKNAGTGKNADDMNVKEFYSLEFGRMRTMQDENGEPLFCGKDVCKALGYVKTDIAVRQHVSNLDVTKRYLKVSGSLRKDGTRTMRSQMMLFVNESGVYSLVFGSKLESAQRFKHWVTSEVLPAIRKNGGYFHINPEETPEQIKARFQKVLEEAIAERDKVIVSLEKDVDRMLPKELYVDNVLDSISCYTTTQIAKELGITAQELNRSLCACHIQYYQSGQYMLYAEYAHMGLAKSRTKSGVKTLDLLVPIGDAERSMKLGQVYTHTYLVWTERGRKFIHDLAKRMWDLAEYERLKFKVKVKCFTKVQMPC
jgi:anti-repressor protein